MSILLFVVPIITDYRNSRTPLGPRTVAAVISRPAMGGVPIGRGLTYNPPPFPVAFKNPDIVVEFLNTFWIAVIAAFAAGGAVGAVLFGALSRGSKDANKLKADFEQKEQEFEAYKSSVAGHFDKTSELVNELTQDYVKVYKHLAEGARNLGEPRSDMDLLEQQQGRVLITVPDAAETRAAETSPEPGEPAPDVTETAEEEPESIDEASREYISETIKEAADIAGKIDDKK